MKPAAAARAAGEADSQGLRDVLGGRKRLSAELLAALAIAACVDTRYVLTGQRDAPPPEVLTQDERELLALFRAAPLAVKAAAIGALQGAASARGTRTTVGGKVVGQVVEGDLVNQGPVVIGKNRGKKK